MSKIVVVGFDIYGDSMYPHLKKFIDKIGKRNETIYIRFRERGFFDVFKSKDGIKEIFKKTYGMLCFFKNLIVDSSKIIKKIGKNDTLIAVDSLTYLVLKCLCGFFTVKEVILWSHDIVVLEGNQNNIFLKIINKTTGRILKKNKLIIQDTDRLKLFCRQHFIKETEINVFLLPVSLPDIDDLSFKTEVDEKVKLLQIGYIHSSRHSDLFLNEYQRVHTKFSLKFHGYISKEILDIVEDLLIKPEISEKRVAVEQIYKIIIASDVGIIGYCTKSNNENFHLISKASCQLVEFLRLGKPIIAIRNKNNLADFIVNEKIGVVLDNISELEEKETLIKENYKEYAAASRLCYEKYFCLDKYLDDLLLWMVQGDKYVKKNLK